jgi:ubiquinone/menaquinone biosynthesis C-methylase UbiE
MGADHTTAHVFDERVARDFEARYEQGFGRFASQQEEALLYQQLQHFPGASSLLEVGYGTGHFTRWFVKQGLQVTGLDTSPAMLEQARLRNGTNYLLGDAQALPFEHQCFVLVALITTLEFVTDIPSRPYAKPCALPDRDSCWASSTGRAWWSTCACCEGSVLAACWRRRIA